MKAFRDVVDCSFEFSLDPSYGLILETLKNAMMELNETFKVSNTNKMHVICVHLEYFLDNFGKGLAKFSEQETENSHSSFDALLDKYKVGDINSKVYHVQYFKAVMTFNTDNV